MVSARSLRASTRAIAQHDEPAGILLDASRPPGRRLLCVDVIALAPVFAPMANSLDYGFGIGRTAQRQHFAKNRRERVHHSGGVDGKHIGAGEIGRAITTDRRANTTFKATAFKGHVG
jgi:hypothetical protein